MAGYRAERVGQEMKRELSRILREDIKDPRIGLITITHVDVSGDLRNAKIYYSSYGIKQNARNVEKGLTKAKGFIKRVIGDRMDLRYVPQLSFIKDDSVEQDLRIQKILKELK